MSEMRKTKIGTFDAVAETMEALSGDGCLLVAGAEPRNGTIRSTEPDLRAVNPMTIGWAEIGIVWGRPVLAVLVRPSRHTHGLMEKATAFSVNVPGSREDDTSLAEACLLCGTKSGRDIDKMKETGLTTEPGLALEVPTLAECPIHYECRIVHKNEVDPATLAPEVKASAYAGGDFHTVYWGEIAGVFRRA